MRQQRRRHYRRSAPISTVTEVAPQVRALWAIIIGGGGLFLLVLLLSR